MLSTFNGLNEIIPNLFLTNYRTVENILSEEKPLVKITHILTVAEELNYEKEAASLKIEYKQIPADDYDSFDLQSYFTEMTDFIHQCLLNQGKIIVHCLMGVSRSATTVMAYLIRFQGLTSEEAFDLVKEKRMVVSPNGGFLDQLKRYEKELKNK